MPAPRVALLLLAPLLVAACSKKAEGPVRTSAAPPGPVTLHFVNATEGDVYVDARYGERLTFEDASGRALPASGFCATSCEACVPRACGSPLFTVRRIPKGGAWETTWRGDFYEASACKGGTSCEVRRLAADGRYTVSLRGRTGAKADPTARGNDPNVVPGSLDEASRECVARGPLTLGPTPSMVDVTWSCAR